MNQNQNQNVSPNVNGTLYFTRDKVIDTESNFNYIPTGSFKAPTTAKMIKKFVKYARKFWLETHWKKLFAYVKIENNNVRLVNSKKEKKVESKNIYNGFDEKAEYIKHKFLDKHELKKIIKEFVKMNPIPNDMYAYEQMLQKYIYNSLKKKIQKKIKKHLKEA